MRLVLVSERNEMTVNHNPPMMPMTLKSSNQFCEIHPQIPMPPFYRNRRIKVCQECRVWLERACGAGF
jgi:hypothetical protein